MKKTLIFTAVFFIFTAFLFTGCGSPKQKIKPEAPAEGNTIKLEAPKNGAPIKETEENAHIGEIDAGETGEDEQTVDPDTSSVPKVQINENYLRNKDERWAAVYGNGEVLDALGKLGLRVATINGIAVAQTNDRDCATTISIGGRLLSAYDFKEALGLKSTMITEIKRGEGEYTFIGYGEN